MQATLLVDGVVQDATSHFSNEASSHKAITPHAVWVTSLLTYTVLRSYMQLYDIKG